MTVHIYDLKGREVRTLALGYRPAGRYVSRTDAAYWDGRNASGERVASGMYLYRIETPHFTQMRRLWLLR